MASEEAKALATEANQKVELSRKRKHSPDLDLFSYDNQIDLTFSYSTKSARNIPINVDSSDEENDNDDVEDDDDGAQEFKRTVDDEDDDDAIILDDSLNDDSQEVQNV